MVSVSLPESDVKVDDIFILLELVEVVPCRV